MFRSIQAIVAGGLVFVIAAAALFRLSGHATEEAPTIGFAIASIVYGIATAVAAGWVTARLSRGGGVGHAVVLAFVVAIVALASFFLSPGMHWTQMLTMFVFAPMAIAGAMAGQRAGGAGPRNA